jgi:hypothetical protein
MKYTKKVLNDKVLFNARKVFGMFGNIQWNVTRMVGEELYIDVSSSTNYPEHKKKEFMGNITKSVQDTLSELKPTIHTQWIDWKPEHGSGGVFDVSKQQL